MSVLTFDKLLDKKKKEICLQNHHNRSIGTYTHEHNFHTKSVLQYLKSCMKAYLYKLSK